MTTYCDGSLVKWVILVFLVCQVSSFPKTLKDDESVKEIFQSKRDIATAGGIAAVPLIKSPMFNPYFLYPPGKPFIFPLVTPQDILLNRLAKAASTTATSPTKPPALDAADPSLMSAYFKAKKDEFLSKLFERLTNGTMVTSDISARSAPVADDATPEPTKPVMDASFFMKKKYEFLDTLFKTLNITATPAPTNATDAEGTNTTTATTTPKPTIVPPDFWFPFAKLPKPTKAPKPTKPPKAKKVLKDALDTILLQSLLLDMGVDPKDVSLSKRASAVAGMSKKSKSKKVKPEEGLTEFQIPPQVDPAMFSAKASDCIDKLFKILNKTETEDLENYVTPKATVVPTNMWAKPSEIEYASKLDAFLDLLIKSLNATETEPVTPEKPEKSKKPKIKPGKKLRKRSTFLDELLHRVTTPAPSTTAAPEPTTPTEEVEVTFTCDFAKVITDHCAGKNCPGISPEDLASFLKDCCCCGKTCAVNSDETGKSSRSLVFKPFGSGYWIPQYLYAAKMGMYLDKLMDTINTAAASEVESESSDVLKRSVTPPADPDDVSGLPSKDAAITLIISELTDLKNDIVDAFAEGIKAQKDATPTSKPFPPAGKSFKKPFWGPKALPTTDPIAPIQKRIDILNDIFDKLTKVEKTLIFAPEPEYDTKLIANLTEILLSNTTIPTKAKPQPKVSPTTTLPNPDSPESYLAKTREYLQALVASKMAAEED